MIAGQSIYHGYRNSTVSWLPKDTQERWLEHIKNPESKARLDELNWTDTSIEYTFNSHGFRADEFTADPGIMFLGCSFTVGIGVDMPRCWTQLVATELNLKNWNLGQAAGAPDTCFRLAYHWIPILKPKYVCVLMPSSNRLELLTLNELWPIRSLYPSMARRSAFYDDWLSVDDNSYLNYTKNKMGIERVCEENNIPLIFQDWNKIDMPEKDFARDLAHPGVKWNKNVAEYFLQNIT